MRVTKYVVTPPECTDILPSDIASMIYDSKLEVRVKETCFGVLIDGEDDIIGSLIGKIRALDPSGIFIKDRGFPPGDSRRCRGSAPDRSTKAVALAFGRRGGGARSGLCMIEAESKVLPLISRALAHLAREESEAAAQSPPGQPCAFKKAEATADKTTTRGDEA